VWKIESTREQISSEETELVAKSDNGSEIRLEARLLPRERAVLLAGGKLKYLRQRDEEPGKGASKGVSTGLGSSDQT
jgi:hypothetical protein